MNKRGYILIEIMLVLLFIVIISCMSIKMIIFGIKYYNNKKSAVSSYFNMEESLKFIEYRIRYKKDINVFKDDVLITDDSQTGNIIKLVGYIWNEEEQLINIKKDVVKVDSNKLQIEYYEKKDDKWDYLTTNTIIDGINNLTISKNNNVIFIQIEDIHGRKCTKFFYTNK